LKEGVLEAGQTLKLVDREKVLVSILELFLFPQQKPLPERAREIVQIPSLNESWRKKYGALC
jgi:MOSC domain-containing protein YiiM